MPAPERTGGNRRVYGEKAVRRLRFVRHARELDFEIDAIRKLLALAGQPQAPCDVADAIAIRHLVEIDKKITRLSSLRNEIARMIEECAHGHISECRVIEVVANHEECLHGRH